jgi:NTE family protein
MERDRDDGPDRSGATLAHGIEHTLSEDDVGNGHRLGLVMSGGGARGAYEVGVLSFIFDELPQRLGRPVRFDVFTGTSVGAIHACYAAASVGTPRAGARLIDIWRNLSVEGVYDLNVSDLVGLPLRFLGVGGRAPAAGLDDRLAGLLDTRPLEQLVREQIPWAELRRRLDSREVDAVAIAATEIESGKSVVWVDRPGTTASNWSRDPFVVARSTALEPRHALASAAIPFIFPALRVDGSFYCDGGLRLNTPLSPALRLGVDRLLVIGLRHVPTTAEDAALAAHRESNYPTLTYLTGKVLNALLLDHVDYDVDRLALTNALLETGLRTYGPDFVDRMNETIVPLRGAPYRVVRHVHLRPSRDLGVMAAECVEHRPAGRGLKGWLADAVVRYAIRGVAMEADLLSYLYFDPCFADHLIELGRRDAEAQSDALATLFE